MDLSKFRRVNGNFDFTFKIRAHQDFKKKDMQIFEQMCCAKHFVILTGLFLRTVYLNISFSMAKKTVPYKKWCYIVNTLYIIIYF